MTENDYTVQFDALKHDKQAVSDTLAHVYKALSEKGYHPINQIVGYLLSGDPAYIPRHNDARNMIKRHERDELLEELVTRYLEDTCSSCD